MPQTPIKSLMLDTRPLEQPDGTYPFGKNGIQYDLKGVAMNEPGFERMTAVIPYKINGVIETDSKPVIFSTDNVNSAIGYFNPETGKYEPIFDDSSYSFKLGFNVDFWITGEAQRNYLNQITIAFSDKSTFPKWLNCDKPNIKRLEDFRLFPYYKTPTLTLKLVEGGRLRPGSYYAAVKLQKNDGTTTANSSVSLGVIVDGKNQDSFTDQAIALTINNTDEAYDYVIVSIISRIDGITTTVELDPVPINMGGPTLVTYTGDNLSQESTLEEILVAPAVYTKVQAMTQLNDALYIVGLDKEQEIADMQPYASQVRVRWVSKLIDAINPPTEHVTGIEKGFMHEEVYALYIRYRLTKGGVSQAFTIPGNIATLSDMSTISEGKVTAKTFKIRDTIHSHSGFTGETGVWYNETESYPYYDDFNGTSIGGEDLRSTYVRHHKMPSIRWCKENLYPDDPEYGKTKLDILGLSVSNIIIPDKYKDVINGYEIFYAKRTISNMTVYGQGLLLHGSVKDADKGKLTGTCDIYTTGSNWSSDVKTKSGTSYDRNNNLQPRLDTMRFHSFDVLLNRPGISPNFISSQLKLSRKGLRKDSMYQDGNNGDHDGNTSYVYLVDFTTSMGTATAPEAGRYIRAIKDGGQYSPNSIDVGHFINAHHETAFTAQLLGLNWPITIQNQGIATDNSGISPDNPLIYADVVETHLINLSALKKDIYSSFFAQTLVTAGNPKALRDSSPFFGGDTFISDYTFHTYGRHEAEDNWSGFTELPYAGKKVVHRFVCESTSNINLRFEEAGNQYSKWYPNTTLVKGDNGVAYPEYWDRNVDPNQFGYNKSLNALNDLVNVTIFSPTRELITSFPFRIHRGGKISRQSKFRSWRTFLPLDYYELQKNMGLPVHMEGMDDRLLIHCENALFATQDKAKLDSGELGVTLGSGDIFQFEPQEAQSAKLGYAGTQHELACVRTPAGYVFTDAKQGEIYLYKGGLRNITGGVGRLLNQHLPTVKGKNPFNGNGITMGWDQKYKRILMTVKNEKPVAAQVTPFTDEPDFWQNLNVGDVVIWHNRYIVYDGLGTPVVPPVIPHFWFGFTELDTTGDPHTEAEYITSVDDTFSIGTEETRNLAEGADLMVDDFKNSADKVLFIQVPNTVPLFTRWSVVGDALQQNQPIDPGFSGDSLIFKTVRDGYTLYVTRIQTSFGGPVVLN